MLWSNFKIQVPGKWVLTGEHSVLKGVTAIALPYTDVSLTLTFEPNSEYGSLKVEPSSAEPLIQELLISAIELWTSIKSPFQLPHGKLVIDSTIPIGAGLGSSAALCVALARWLAGSLVIAENQCTEFATQLEHRFHGRSSGMDVAVIAANEPISFRMGKEVCLMGAKKLPKFTFHDTGLRSRTHECVLNVENFRNEMPERALQVDEVMNAASRTAIEGLMSYHLGEIGKGLELIQKGMLLARECFYAWRLVPEEAKALEEQLLAQGALAVKMTGAGGGGMVVALWGEAKRGC